VRGAAGGFGAVFVFYAGGIDPNKGAAVAVSCVAGGRFGGCVHLGIAGGYSIFWGHSSSREKRFAATPTSAVSVLDGILNQNPLPSKRRLDDWSPLFRPRKPGDLTPLRFR